MTCVVGLEHEGHVYIGADSAGVAGYGLTVRADEKVFTRDRRQDRWVFGFTSSFRMGQLLRYRLELPEPPERDDELPAYMTNVFVEAVRKCLRDGGWLWTENGRERAGTFSVGYRGHLFTIESDLQVARAVDAFVALGCGDDLALGAMHALGERGDVGPVERIEAALRAAERFSAGVRGPFVVQSTVR